MQGFNMGRYVPPELEGTVSSNAASGKGHPLGARARKLKTEGILTVRFECPFAIWCDHCKPEQIIGQGVRFNAEKKKVGNYYSTPIWSFKFKHTVCGGWLEVRTDPKNAEYVVAEGGRRRDYGDVDDGLGRERTTEEQKERLEKDGGFGVVEKRVDDKRKLLSESQRLEELRKRSERDWDDPYGMSRRLRKGFRAGRKERQAAEVKGEALKDKLSLGIELVEERAEDAERARFVDFGDEVARDDGDEKQLFGPSKLSTSATPNRDRGKRGKELSAADLAEEKKLRLQKRLTSSTKAAIDPFLNEERVWQPKIRRKATHPVETAREKADPSALLVSYDSDSS